MAEDLEDDIVLGPEEVDVVPPLEAKPEVVTPEEGIETLKAQLAAEREARAAAEAARDEQARRAASATSQATDAAKDKHESELALVTNAIETLKQGSEMAKANYAAAMAAGDWDAAAEAQSVMSINAAKSVRLDEAKTKMEAGPPEPRIEPINDPVEAMAMSLSPQSAAWVRAHPEYARDGVKTRRMIAAHNLAETDGLRADTPEYFAAIETTLGIRRQEVREEPSEPMLSEASQRREVQPPAAPAGQNGSRRRITLTAEQREAAEISGLTPEEYAKNLVATQGRPH